MLPTINLWLENLKVLMLSSYATKQIHCYFIDVACFLAYIVWRNRKPFNSSTTANDPLNTPLTDGGVVSHQPFSPLLLWIATSCVPGPYSTWLAVRHRTLLLHSPAERRHFPLVATNERDFIYLLFVCCRTWISCMCSCSMCVLDVILTNTVTRSPYRT